MHWGLFCPKIISIIPEVWNLFDVLEGVCGVECLREGTIETGLVEQADGWIGVVKVDVRDLSWGLQCMTRQGWPWLWIRYRHLCTGRQLRDLFWSQWLGQNWWGHCRLWSLYRWLHSHQHWSCGRCRQLSRYGRVYRNELGRWGAISVTGMTKVGIRENCRASEEVRDFVALRSLESISCAA